VKALLRSMTNKYGRKYTDPASIAEIPRFIAQVRRARCGCVRR
jgi:hypothetical protein